MIRGPDRPAAWAGLFLSFFLGPVSRASAAPDKTNILLITIDTLRSDRLSCYDSSHVATPRIDALAARGVLFERAFAHVPMTLPSHASILLGLTPLTHGVSENGRSFVSDDFLSLAELLHGRGFATGAFVSAFVLDSRFGLDQGFDVYDDHYPSRPVSDSGYSERRAGMTIEAALAWLAKRKGAWFCWIHLWDPHAPYEPPEPFASRFARDPYSGEVAYVDTELGRLFDEGTRSGWLERTLVILTGDHGEALGEHGEEGHGYFAYNTTLWVPLIIVGPGVRPSRTKVPVAHTDVFPTLCDVLGIEKPRPLDGVSLAPFLRGRTRPQAPIYFEALDAYLNRGWAPLRGIIDGERKYIDSPLSELYDLRRDFGETRNLASTEDPAVLRERLGELRKTAGAAVPSGQGAGRLDSEAKARLRSLGYLVAPVTKVKPLFGPEDDLKTLLPLERKRAAAEEARRQGRLEESARILEDILKARPDFAAIYDQLSQLYAGAGRMADALAVLERGAGANPENDVLAASLGLALVKAGYFDRGAEALGRALAANDRDPEIWGALGIVAGKKGDDRRAEEYFGRALDLDPEDAVINDNAGGFHATRAMKNRDPREAERAVAYFRKSISSDPGLASAHNGLGGALRLLGRTDEAVASWERAVALAPEYGDPRYNLGLVYLERGEKERALRSFERYLAIEGPRLSEAERREVEALLEKCRR